MKKTKKTDEIKGFRVTAMELVPGFNKITPLEIDQVLYRQEEKLGRGSACAAYLDMHFKGNVAYIEFGISTFRIERRPVFSRIYLLYQGVLN